MSAGNTMSNTHTLTLDTDEQRVSYGFGWQFGQQLQRNTFSGLDVDIVCEAIKQCFAGKPSQVGPAELNKAYDVIQEKMQAAAAELARKTVELGQQFLTENAKREGVVATGSGIQYEILESAEGDKPTATNTVRVHYHGTFIDGRVFDSSVERGEPAEFALNQVIPGWTEVLQLMPAGSKWRVAIPSHLAYGEAGSPPVIPGNSVLVFEIHLIDIL